MYRHCANGKKRRRTTTRSRHGEGAVAVHTKSGSVLQHNLALRDIKDPEVVEKRGVLSLKPRLSPKENEQWKWKVHPGQAAVVSTAP